MTSTFKPTVWIDEDAKRQMDAYIQAVTTEISGLGYVENRNGYFYVTRVLLFPQIVSSGDTEISQAAVADYMYNELQAGRSTKMMRVWWHSHATMGVFWSGRDNQTIEGFRNEWMVSIVGNHAGEYLARLDSYKPLSIEGVDLEIKTAYRRDNRLEKSVRDEIKAKVTKRPEIKLPKGAYSGLIEAD